MKTKKIWMGVPALLYLVFVFWIVIIFLPIVIINNIPGYAISIIESGFANPDINTQLLSIITVFSLLIGLSLLIPLNRRMYYTFPWLYPYVKILFVDYIILSVSIIILNYGHMEDNDSRRLLFKVLAIIFFIVARITQCIYFKHKKVAALGGE